MLGDKWEWNGTNWTDRTISNINILHPSGTARFAMAFGTRHGDCVVTSGTSGTGSFGTWVYGPITPGHAKPFGRGCAGTPGTPVLRTLGSSVPWIGGQLEPQVTSIGTNHVVNPACVFLGFSSTNFGSFTLPLDMGFVGMPGCTLLTSMDALLPTQNLGPGTAWAALLMPLAPSMIGLGFYAQGTELDAAANPLGMVLSNGLILVLGGLL